MAKNTKKIKPTTLKRIKPSFAIEKSFYNSLKKLSESINDSVIWWSMARYNKTFNKNVSKQLTFEFNKLLDKWQVKTDEIADKLAKRLSRNVEKYANYNFTSQNEAFNVLVRNKGVKNQLNAIYERNYNLIKSLPSEIIDRYRNAFLDNVGSFDREAIYKQAKIFKGISNRKAKLIARDQTQKAVVGYTQARAEQLGFKYYQWITAGDNRVSNEHKHLNGRIYRYDKPSAIIDSYGNVGHPSQRVNCRCVQVSIILEPNQEAKLIRDNKNGDYYEIVKKD